MVELPLCPVIKHRGNLEKCRGERTRLEGRWRGSDRTEEIETPELGGLCDAQKKKDGSSA